MNKNEINDEMAVRYILGDLPEEQAEEFDELSVTDGEFFDRIAAAENDLVDRYVNGELKNGEAVLFESNYLSSPTRREKVRLARSFQEYAGQHLAQQEKSTMTQAERSENERVGGIWAWLESLGIFGGAQPAFRFAAAACGLLVAVLGGWLVLSVLRNGNGREVAVNSTGNIVSPTVQPSVRTPENRSGDSVPTPLPVENRANATPVPSATSVKPTPAAKLEAPSQPVIASFILTPPLRGGAAPGVKIPAAADRAAARVELESDDYKFYTVQLKDDGGRVVWSSGRRSASGKQASRYLNLTIPAKTLRPAVYTLSVSGLTDDGTREIVGDYPFRVVR